MQAPALPENEAQPIAELRFRVAETKRARMVASGALLIFFLALPSFAFGKSPQQIFTEVSPSIIGILAVSVDGKRLSQGSGIVYAPQLVATNCHVIKNSSFIRANYHGDNYSALIVEEDTARDVCILRVLGLKAPAIKERISVSKLKVGQNVYAIGNPLGLDLTLTEGLISALRNIDGGTVIQISASIAPGSSGGGLFDSNGALIGITTLGSQGFQGFNFAIPADWITTPTSIVGSEGIDSKFPKIAEDKCKELYDDAAAPVVAFDNEKDARAWLASMSPRLTQIIPDRIAREEFLLTAHYEAKRAGLDPQLVLAMIEVLSGYQKDRISSSRAIGLMQVRDVWINRLGCPNLNLTFMRANLRFGTIILRSFLDQNRGNLFKALNAYRKDSDPSARADTPDFPNAVLQAWKKHWDYHP